MEGRYNTRSPAVKRLMKEAQEMSQPTDQYYAQPLEDNLFEWHFTVRGPSDSEFQHGIYHGRIILPVDYPMKPPSIIWLTPNGRFETNKKICLSISGHHPESWQPSWSIRTALLAIIGFMPTHGGGAIGSLDYTADERKILAKKSRDWKCPICGDVSSLLLEPSPENKQTSEEVKKLASQIKMQPEAKKASKSSSSTDLKTSTSDQTSKPATVQVSTSSPEVSQSNPPPTFPWASQQTGNFYPWTAPPFGPPLGYLASQGDPRFSSVSMFARFPYPPGHNRYESPFFMPGIPMMPPVLRSPMMNQPMARLISPTPSPEKEMVKTDTVDKQDEATGGAEGGQEVKEEDAKGMDSQHKISSSAHELGQFNESGVKGVRHRSVTSSQPSQEVEGVRSVPATPRANREDLDSASGDRSDAAGQVAQAANQNTDVRITARLRLDYQGLLIIVLSIGMVLLLLKRILQWGSLANLI